MRLSLAAAAAAFLQSATCQTAVDPKASSVTIDESLIEDIVSDHREQSQGIKDQVQRLKQAYLKSDGTRKNLPLLFADPRSNADRTNGIRGSQRQRDDGNDEDRDRKLQSNVVTCSEGYSGYDNWGVLALDILVRYVDNLPGTTWTLCPNTVFDADISIDLGNGTVLTFLWILQSNTVLRCGTSGTSEGNCIIANGERGVHIDTLEGNPPVSGAQLQGLTFGSTGTLGAPQNAVIALEASEASIQDCVFENAESTSEVLYIGVFAFNGAVLSIEDCEFNSNFYGSGILAGSSSVFVSNTRFDDNLNVYSNNMISALSGGTLTLSNSCFTDNLSIFADGVVLIDSTSTLLSNVNNYGAGNSGDATSTFPFCNGVLLNATLTCLPFDASVCALDSSTPAPVTPAPVTLAPVTLAPTASPSEGPISITPAPVTQAPVINGTTPAPVTPAPVINGTTPAPVTGSPITPAPVTPAPVITNAPIQKEFTTTFFGDNGLFGNMFDLVSLKPIEITTFDLHCNTTNTVAGFVYTKEGSYGGFETQQTAWSFGGSATMVGAGAGIPTIVPNFLNAPIAMDAGAKQAFYVTLTTADILYTNGIQEGRLFIFNEELQFFEGAGLAYPFGAGTPTYAPRNFNGVVHYSIVSDASTTPAPTPAPVATTQLPTTFAGGNGSYGNMFDVSAVQSLDLREMSIHSAANGTINVLLYSKTGTYKNFEAQTENWMYIGGAMDLQSRGVNNPTKLPSNTFSPVTIAAGGRRAFYVTLDTGEILYSNTNQPEGQLYVFNNDLRFYVGAGVVYPFFGSFPSRIFNGQLRYILNPSVAPLPPTPSPLTPAPTPAPLTCIDTWEKLVMATFDNINEPSTFVLCPETTFNADINFEYGGVIWEEAYIFSSDTTIQCGDDGLSSNNCLIVGGYFGIAVPDFSEINIPFVENSGIRGLTFSMTEDEASTELPLYFEGGHQLFVQDCIFNAGFNGIFALNGASVTVEDCVFENNEHGNSIVAFQSPVTITNTLFYSNTYSDRTAIWAFGGETLSLTNNCFIENDGLISNGIAVIESGTTLKTSANNYAVSNIAGSSGNGNTGSFCNGVLFNETLACVEFDATECALDGIMVPPHTAAPVTPAPTLSPNASPGKVPTMSPTKDPTASPSQGSTTALTQSPTGAPVVTPSDNGSGGASPPSSPSQPSPPTSSSTEDSGGDDGDDNTPIIAGVAAGGGILILAAIGGAMYARNKAKGNRSDYNSAGGASGASPVVPPPIAPIVNAAPAPVADVPVAVPAPAPSSAATGITKTVIRKVISADGTETVTKHVVPV